jgi:hypothetical protein
LFASVCGGSNLSNPMIMISSHQIKSLESYLPHVFHQCLYEAGFPIKLELTC